MDEAAPNGESGGPARGGRMVEFLEVRRRCRAAGCPGDPRPSRLAGRPWPRGQGTLPRPVRCRSGRQTAAQMVPITGFGVRFAYRAHMPYNI